MEPLPVSELEPVFELSEDPLDALEFPEEESLDPEFPLDAVLFPESEEDPELELEPESEVPELLELLAVSDEELDPELESLELPEFPDELEESEVLEEVWSEEPDDPLLELESAGGVVVEPPLLSVLSAGGVTGFPEPSPGTNTTPGLPLFPGTPPVAVCWLPRKKNGNKRPFFLWPQL